MYCFIELIEFNNATKITLSFDFKKNQTIHVAYQLLYIFLRTNEKEKAKTVYVRNVFYDIH